MRSCLSVLLPFTLLLSACDLLSQSELPADLSDDLGIAVHTSTAFKNKVPGLNREQIAWFAAGRSFFQQPWVAAPTATIARDGVGPLMNANACSACHANNGQGRAPDQGGREALSSLIRLSLLDDHQPDLPAGVIPHPVYGGQFQDRANFGLPPEGKVSVRYEYSQQTTADGEVIELRKPVWQLDQLSHGAMQIMDKTLAISARVAPRIVGMGLLDRIPESQILAYADPEDRDGDGISGKAARVYDIESGDWLLGRYGWKAEASTLKQQVAAALNGDMGLTTALFPFENCSSEQAICEQQASGNDAPGLPEVQDHLLDKMTFYTAHLAVPTPRLNQQTQAGWQAFNELGCESCHKVGYETAGDGLLAGKTIWPFSDMLLHDMGPALSDGRPVFNAQGAEWRTAPLWGIGLAQKVVRKRSVNYLHDGRARTLQEAIVWHGGEAEKSKQAFLQADKEKRLLLLQFLDSI